MRRILLSLPYLLLSPQMGGGLGPIGGSIAKGGN